MRPGTEWWRGVRDTRPDTTTTASSSSSSSAAAATTTTTTTTTTICVQIVLQTPPPQKKKSVFWPNVDDYHGRLRACMESHFDLRYLRLSQRTLLHVRQWAVFENKHTKFGAPSPSPPRKSQSPKCLFSRGFTTSSRLMRECLANKTRHWQTKEKDFVTMVILQTVPCISQIWWTELTNGITFFAFASVLAPNGSQTHVTTCSEISQIWKCTSKIWGKPPNFWRAFGSSPL